MKIGFFDSGVGGMTVLWRALRLLPREDYIYFADTAHVPYGEKTKSEVRDFVFEAVEFLAGKNIKALVIACNAATSAAAKELRKEFGFPIIGIEPAVKPAIQRSQQKGKRVLVLSTHLTLREEKYNNLVARLDDDGLVDGLALPGLVAFAERFEFRPEVVLPYIKEELARFTVERYGTVVLGCTHFPLFTDMLRQLFPAGTDIIDGGLGTAMNLKRILTEQKLLNGGSGEIEYYSSGSKIEDGEKLDRYSGLLARLDHIYG